MKAPALDRYAADFERLAALPESERAAALAALPLREDDRDLLRRLLDADADPDDRLARALGAGAARLTTSARHDRLGPYRLLRELGAGGMGTVFLAERVDGGFAQQVAIKLLRGFPTADGLRRLRQERQILADLAHPHIARLIDGGETPDGQPWLALEYIDGLALLDYAARHVSRRSERLALFDAILDAVGHAHQRLVVHRDIKPANVLVNGAGEVKLLDFGIARLIDLHDDSFVRETSTRVYSAGYASPEQRDGGAITTASDIYSLGILLRELVTGGAAQSPGLDAGLAGIIAKATDDDPAQRYASAGEFRDDLDRHRAGLPVRAVRMTRLYRLRKFVGRHRLGVAAGVLAALALGFFVWRLEHERDRAVAAELAAERNAERARAALTFLTETFEAAAPGNALSKTVSVRDLLDKATVRIDEADFDADVTASIRRMLATLSYTLGDHDSALEHYRHGFAGGTPEDRDQALAMAQDMDRYANLLGTIDRNAEARDMVDQAARLRERFAPGDAVEQAFSAHARATWQRYAGEHGNAIASFRSILDLPSQGVVLPTGLEISAAAHLSTLLARNDGCAEAIIVADRGLGLLPRGEAPTPQRLWLLRSQATALRQCGRAPEAEVAFRELIALESRTVGDRSMGMLQLVNELSITLGDLGRYREAAQVLQAAQLPDGLGAYNRAVILINLAAAFDGAGDYPRALELANEARILMDEAGVDPDSVGLRTFERTHARFVALNGQPDQAIAALKDLRERARRIDGEDSAGYANATWQLVFAMRLAGKTEGMARLLDELERLWTPKYAATHENFVRIHRARAALALMTDQVDLAERELATALRLLREGSGPASAIAVVLAEQAGVRLRQGRIDEARASLHSALPDLRAAFLPGQIDRAEAERLAVKLGM